MKTVELKIWAFQPGSYSGLARLFTWIVCAWTKSRFGHIGFSLGADYYEADIKTGVTRFNNVPPRATPIYRGRTSQTVVDWVEQQVGKPYDIRGVLGFLTHKCHDSDYHLRWFCSELATAVLRRSGVHILPGIPAFRISPGMLVNAFHPKLACFFR